MKGERRLRLVPPSGTSSGAPGDAPGAGPWEGAGEPPPTETELREAEALREAMEHDRDPLAASLRAAFRPAPLDEGDLEALLARAIGDTGSVESPGRVDAPPTKIEQREAERLRAELDAQEEGAAAGGRMSEQAELAGALRAAWAPRPLEPAKNEALVAAALRKMPLAAPRRRALPVTMAALATAAAMAAGVALLIGRMGGPESSSLQSAASPPSAVMAGAQVDLIRARSAAELFDPATPFPRTGGESARIDRIASARAADLRANRFAAWGVP